MKELRVILLVDASSEDRHRSEKKGMGRGTDTDI